MTTNSPTTSEKIQRLPWAIGFNGANSFFVQLTFFGSVFVLFLDQLGFNKAQIGGTLSILQFLVIVSLFSVPLVNRLGNKRSFMVFWGLRTVITIGLLFAPWILASYGIQAAFNYVILITGGFSFAKAIALTGLLPWQKEYIPDHIRGKFSAISDIAVSIASIVAIGISGYVLNRFAGLNSYILLIGLGIFFGFIALISAAKIPGGKANPDDRIPNRRLLDVFLPMQDKGFLAFLIGSALVTLSAGPLNSFLPLFMGEDVGLSSGDVVYLGIGTLVGVIVTAYFWGWTADRYGSRPIMLVGLLLKAIQPLFFIMLPRFSPASLPTALVIYFFGGFATLGWTLGSSRLLMISIIPDEKAQDYSAVYYSWVGVMAGISALLGGWLLERFADLKMDLMGISIDSYTLLFLIGFIFPMGAFLILRRLKDPRAVGVGRFMGLFYHGNPIMAMEAMLRFHLAKDEYTTVAVTERLGQSHSPLTVDELIEALDDPRFYVRFEALISIGRHGSDERLNQALEAVLLGSDPAMSVVAAWAMGRTLDSKSILPLRRALISPYRSVRAHAARSLATLDDVDAIPILADSLENEDDFGLRVAYATSLGKLNYHQVTSDLLHLLREAEEEATRHEIALALARLLGNENAYIQLLRTARKDPGTTISRSLQRYSGKFAEIPLEPEISTLIEESYQAFAHHTLDLGVEKLVEFGSAIPVDQFSLYKRLILNEAINQMKIHKSSLLEYPILVLLIFQEM